MAEDVRREGLFYPGPEIAEEIERRTASPREGGAEPISVKRGLQRRTIFRWAGWGTIMLLLAQWSAGFVGFFTPKKVGAFGGEISAGAVTDFQVGEVKVIQEGKFYISRVPQGVLALWWKCPHLGCTVPWKPDDPSMDQLANKGRFNCPCHGSIYDRFGQIVQGPAPRPMDLFPTEIRDGKIFVTANPTKAVTRAVADGSDATAV
jgi:cytochrome b6-f complex iron-sulfur subunit